MMSFIQFKQAYKDAVLPADRSQDWPLYGADASDMYFGRDVQLKSAEQAYRSAAAAGPCCRAGPAAPVEAVKGI